MNPTAGGAVPAVLLELAELDRPALAQREACAAFILSQKAEGWKALPECYDDGGHSGGSTERPALQRRLTDVAARRVRVIVGYKVDRLTRSLTDFAKLAELFDAHGVSFVSVTQQFNTTSSMGRLTLNVLLSFAQFEREVTGERIRDKIAASKRKALRWPTHELEDAVLGALIRFLNDDARLLELIGAVSARELSDRLASARHLLEQLSSGSLPDRIAILQRTVSRITVSDGGITVHFRIDQLGSSDHSAG